METYTAPKSFEVYPDFQSDKHHVLGSLDMSLIDDPLISLINGLNTLPYLFTLQCCYGHFSTNDGEEISDFEFSDSANKVTYRLAYIAFCIENSPSGKKFIQQINDLSLTIAQGLVKFCSAQWFWDQWVNSYVVQ